MYAARIKPGTVLWCAASMLRGGRRSSGRSQSTWCCSLSTWCCSQSTWCCSLSSTWQWRVSHLFGRSFGRYGGRRGVWSEGFVLHLRQEQTDASKVANGMPSQMTTIPYHAPATTPDHETATARHWRNVSTQSLIHNQSYTVHLIWPGAHGGLTVGLIFDRWITTRGVDCWIAVRQVDYHTWGSSILKKTPEGNLYGDDELACRFFQQAEKCVLRTHVRVTLFLLRRLGLVLSKPRAMHMRTCARRAPSAICLHLGVF